MRRAALLVIAACVLAGAQEPLPRHAELLPKDWSARDLEGRWAYYSADVARGPAARNDRRAEWIELLLDTKDWGVLGWIAISEPGFPGGIALQDADAPNWIAVTVWVARNANRTPVNDSHGLNAARDQFLGYKQPKNRGVILAWLGLHPQVATEELAILLRDVKATEDDRRRAAGQFPPLHPDDVFAGLTTPESVHEFGDRTRAAPGEFYLHQLRRSLAAFALCPRLHVEPWSGKVVALFAHPNQEVQREALLTATMLAPKLVPIGAVIDMARDAAEAPRVREAAVMALTFAFESPRAWAEVHRVIGDPAHPGFKVAVSRLGDVGDEFSYQRLVMAESKAGADAELVRDARDRLVRGGNFKRDPMRADVERILLRAAHLSLTVDPMALEHIRWMKPVVLPNFLDPTRRHILAAIRDEFALPAGTDVDGISPTGKPIRVLPEEAAASVRAFAALVLESPTSRPR
jgi:hypothetical protein